MIKCGDDDQMRENPFFAWRRHLQLKKLNQEILLADQQEEVSPVSWSVFRAIWLKRQDAQLSNDVYEGGVLIWSKSVKTRIFSKKLAEKLLFGRTQILIR